MSKKTNGLPEAPLQSLELAAAVQESTWLATELAGRHFNDERLDKRFLQLTGKMWAGIGQSIPFACQDWANTKAAYRFLSNENVNEADILEGHFRATAERFSAADGMTLVLQDTTEFSYKREKPEAIGAINLQKTQHKDEYGHPQYHTQCGVLMHASLVVTTSGVPLGLAAVKYWTRDKFKGTNSLKKRINPTRMPIEGKESYRWLENMRLSTERLNNPRRCVHIGDRESDIYELFSLAQELDTHFLVRTCVDRLAGNGDHKISSAMNEVAIKAHHDIDMVDAKGKHTSVKLVIKYHQLQVLPPVGKQKKYAPLSLTVIHAEEQDSPENRPAISWKLITNLLVTTNESAIEKLQWYALRWRIETFHKILKSCCKAEESKLRTADRLTNLIAIFCIFSWRIFWMTMVVRSDPDVPPEIALTPTEIKLLDQLPSRSAKISSKTLTEYMTKIACLGGYLNRKSDPPPGNLLIWRGLNRLADIITGFEISGLVGN